MIRKSFFVLYMCLTKHSLSKEMCKKRNKDSIISK